ncbi:uncharacterized protein TNIN_70181, partial [Trichonephila inaurata madagascariensis]
MSLKNILAKKRTFKTQLTKLRQQIDDEGVLLSDLEVLKSKFKVLEVDLNSTFDSLFELSTEECIETYINEKEEIDERILEVEFALSRKLTKFVNENKTETSGFSVTKSENNLNVRLPKITLPTFSGNLHEWLSFKDIFEASVDSNPYLTDVVKLQYLKSALRGDALRIIQSISIVDSNYKLAFSLLEERYSNHREQVYAHLKRFLSVQPVHNESASAILNLIDVTNECVRSLEVLNQSVEGFSSILFAYILGEKLDPNTKIWWERKLEKENLPTVTDLLEFLKDHARTLNASKSVINVKKITNKSFAIVSNSNDKHPQNLCKLCNLSCHRLFKCPKFLKFSVKERVDYVKKQNLCFSCFLKHSVRNCTSSYICRNCLKKHNVLLCYQSETNFSGFSSEKPNAVRDQCESSNQSKTALNDSSTPVTDSNKTNSQVERSVRLGNVLVPEFIPKNSLSFMSNQT